MHAAIQTPHAPGNPWFYHLSGMMKIELNILQGWNIQGWNNRNICTAPWMSRRQSMHDALRILHAPGNSWSYHLSGRIEIRKCQLTK